MDEWDKRKGIHFAPWTAQIPTSAVRSIENAKHVPKIDGHSSVDSHMVACSPALPQYLSLSKIRWRPTRPHRGSAGSTVKGQRVVETENGLVFGRRDYCRHVIQRSRLAILTKATGATRWLQHLTNMTELKSFLCLCNIFERLNGRYGA